MTEPRRVKAADWFRITGRGIVVSVDVAETDGIRHGDHVRFELHPNGPGTPGLISADETYRVSGIEESRCLVAHGNGKQCVMGRGLVVSPVRWCVCGHVQTDHNGPHDDCAARCLCDICPDDTANDCWCAGFKPAVPAVSGNQP